LLFFDPPLSAKPKSIERARTSRALVCEVRCALGPGDRPYPERHGSWTIALVRHGSFDYRAHDARRARELREGWLLLGRDGAEFECAHRTCAGDVCTALEIAPALLEDVRASLRLAGRDPFPQSVLPPVTRVAGMFAAADRAAATGSGFDADALALQVVASVLSACGAETPASRDPSRADRERVRAALDVMDARPHEPWPLGDLAAHVGASPFHFARAFRDIVGTTPHRYLVSARLRRAAVRLLDTRDRITDIAFDVGFGDLSNFIHTFRREMGATPRDFRAQASARRSPV
jgi:AraC family transcriptional regulator